MAKLLLSVVLSTVVLFVWSGVTQLLPWGVTTVQNLTMLPEGDERLAGYDVQRVEAGVLTTPRFDESFLGRISTYSTDATFSWIVTQPMATDYSSYFLREALTQFFVAMLLVDFLAETRRWPSAWRISAVALGGVAASIACYGQLMNWWAVPMAYGLGVSFNLVAGWTLAAFPPPLLLRSP